MPKPLKRSLTLPTVRPQPPLMKPHPLTPKSKTPPANWGQALKAGLSDALAPVVSTPQGTGPLPSFAESSLRRLNLASAAAEGALGNMKNAAAAIGVAPEYSRARSKELYCSVQLCGFRTDPSTLHSKICGFTCTCCRDTTFAVGVFNFT